MKMMDNTIKLYLGDNLETLKKLPDNSVDSIVTDPPYGLSFMNKKWDYDIPSVELWKECYRVLKHGGHVLSFGGTRTYHRMVVNIEDAGFEIRDQIMWIYGSGFPKSFNIGKAIDKLEGNERQVVDYKYQNRNPNGKNGIGLSGNKNIQIREINEDTIGNSKWEGWGTALKPANEPICVARKPLSEKSVAENVLKWGTGGINIDGCRIELREGDDSRLGGNGSFKTDKSAKNIYSGGYKGDEIQTSSLGRFPANVILDEEAGKMLDEQSGISKSNPRTTCDRRTNSTHNYGFKSDSYSPHNDIGGASRFFYCPKASKKDRDEGLESFEVKRTGSLNATEQGTMLTGSGNERETKRANIHPTVKPTDLMRYLCRLVTPKNGIVLDPFMGSGSTGKGAILEGFSFIGMELDVEYFNIAKTRIEDADKKFKDSKKQLKAL